jgi:hypothetical protein
MQILNQLLRFLQDGLAAIFKFVHTVWTWSTKEILDVPWDQISSFPWWKDIILVIVGGAIVYLLYKAVMELLDAGQKALGAIATLLSVVVKTLPPILLAGLAAAVGAWVLNNVNF